MPEEKNLNEEMQNKIQEIQILEQNLRNLLLQKQAFQIELNETENALSEILNSKDDVFKLIGQIMIKSNKDKLSEELKKKKELLSLRLDSIEKQESEATKNLEELRKDIMKNIK